MPNPRLEDYSDAVIGKARWALDRNGVEPDKQSEDVFRVKSSSGVKGRYRVQIWPEGSLTCTCDNGKKKGGTPNCFHTAAVLLYLERKYLDE